MILKALTTLAVIGTLGVVAQLAGCSSGSTVSVGTVVTDAQQVCAFAPTVATVEAELNANPTITDATAIASAICQALSAVNAAPPATVGATATPVDKTWVTVTVNGKSVPIAGHFVAK